MLCKRVDIQLEKDGHSFGFTLRGGTSDEAIKSRPLTVTQIRPGSSADRSDQDSYQVTQLLRGGGFRDFLSMQTVRRHWVHDNMTRLEIVQRQPEPLW